MKTYKLPKWSKGTGKKTFPKFQKAKVPKFQKVKLGVKMPTKLRKIFQEKYGKKKGTRIFYAWENKQKSKLNRRK